MSGMIAIEAVRKTVTVECTVEEAFRIFTADALSWWPTGSHSIHGDEVQDLVFEAREGGEVYEVSANGTRGHWATVLEWDPPARLVLAWNVLLAETEPTEVEVRFSPEGDSTRVDLEHRGWERLAEGGPEKRSNYDTGWDLVLGRYVERI